MIKNIHYLLVVIPCLAKGTVRFFEHNIKTYSFRAPTELCHKKCTISVYSKATYAMALGAIGINVMYIRISKSKKTYLFTHIFIKYFFKVVTKINTI